MKIGYRCWFLDCDGDEPILRSLLAESGWEGPIFECDRPIENDEIGDVFELGVENKGYGVHSYNSPEMIEAAVHSEGVGGLLIGVVGNYGLIRIHQRGYRSQYSQVLALSRNIRCDVVTRDNDVPRFCDKRADHYITDIFSCDEHVATLRKSYGIYEDRLPVKDLDEIFVGLMKRYHCDIIDGNDIYTYGKEYDNGSW